jgi:DNA-binding MarR family transcriptional regulator
MTRKPGPADRLRTPHAKLSEAPLHGIVGYQLAQAKIVTDQVFDELARRTGLRKVEFTLLGLLRANTGASARQLARALAVTPPNIAIWLDKLENRGLVTRARSATDARVQHIHLTNAGRILVDRTVQSLLDGEQEALAALSHAERAMLVELLHKVALLRRHAEAGGSVAR